MEDECFAAAVEPMAESLPVTEQGLMGDFYGAGPREGVAVEGEQSGLPVGGEHLGEVGGVESQ